MIFAHDTETILRAAARLVNSDSPTSGDLLTERAQLDEFLASEGYSGEILGTVAELTRVRALRPRLRRFWDVPDRDEAAALVNELLVEADARPYLSRHDELDWHLHLTRDDQPLEHRIAAETAMAFLDLIRTDEWARMKTCGATDCADVLVDLSKNRSKRFCDGGCANRMHVTAYRARQRG
ncbi:CGNR zinc finger domain-containing protein [Microlunatus speluncae]|uniref:CGNR zinc finger domain-containing protein n=1 Tax=Microlunatus speluncae TaxID=2594267 RepID=UPI0012667652|nr:CGNR zinc finger domain-containing protein [Microlunatus speluncae]